MFGLGKNKLGGGSASHLPANLQDDQLRFKVIIDNIEDGVVMIDADRVVRLINPGGALVCGWPTEEATGIEVGNVIKLVDAKGEPRTSVDDPFAKVFKTGQTLRDNTAFLVNRDKKQIPISRTRNFNLLIINTFKENV